MDVGDSAEAVLMETLEDAQDFDFCYYFLFLVNISLLSFLFCDFFFLFQDNKTILKQAPDHNQQNTIYQPGQCPFKK